MGIVLNYTNLSQILQSLQEGISCIKDNLFGLSKSPVLSALVYHHWGKLVKSEPHLVVLEEEI